MKQSFFTISLPVTDEWIKDNEGGAEMVEKLTNRLLIDALRAADDETFEKELNGEPDPTQKLVGFLSEK